jgi:hypothetical protein
MTELVSIPVGKHTRRVEPTGELVRDIWESTELHAPSLLDWAPQAFSSKTLERRSFRWPVLVASLLAIIVTAGLGLWAYQQPAASAATALAQVRTDAATLTETLQRATPAVAALAAETVPGVIPDSTLFLEMGEGARAMFAASGDLPASGSPERAAAADAAGLVLDSSRQLMDAVAYRTALEPALTPPLLETDPTLIDLTVATAAFTEWRSHFQTVHEGLPARASGQASLLLAEVIEELDGIQVVYLDALRTGDQPSAVTAVEGLEASLMSIRDALLTDMGELSSAVTGLIEEAQTKLAPLLG